MTADEGRQHQKQDLTTTSSAHLLSSAVVASWAMTNRNTTRNPLDRASTQSIPHPSDAHPLDAICIDRNCTGNAGQSEQSVIRTGDTVDAYSSCAYVRRGRVVEICLARNEVCVRFEDDTKGEWFPVGYVYLAKLVPDKS